MNLERLLQSTGPRLHLMVATPSEATNLGWSLARADAGQAVVRFLRGQKMQTAPELFDEFAAALQFPYYFGENWNALWECLSDLEWLPEGPCILLILDGKQLLAREVEESLAVFLDFLTVVTEEWTTTGKGPLEPAPRSFHVVFQCVPDDEVRFVSRMHAAGATLDRLS
jgi:RNAse (barnase) inhibitor barstar